MVTSKRRQPSRPITVGYALISVVHARVVTVTSFGRRTARFDLCSDLGRLSPSWFTVVVACPDRLHAFTSFSSFVPVSSPPSACTALHGSNSQIPISPFPVTGRKGRSKHTFPPEPGYSSVLILGRSIVLPYSHPVAS